MLFNRQQNGVTHDQFFDQQIEFILKTGHDSIYLCKEISLFVIDSISGGRRQTVELI